MLATSIHSLEQTEALALALAPLLADGSVLLLEGDIGAGKTTFVGALARALGSLEPARSPTYTVAHEYALADGRRFAHLDLYRQQGQIDDPAWADLEPVLEAQIVAIEWPGAAAGRVTQPAWVLRFEPLGHDRRLAWVTAPDSALARAFAVRLGEQASAGGAASAVSDPASAPSRARG